MTKNKKYTALLNQQVATLKKENRFLEFKSNYQDYNRLGKYISALSNGACLDHQDFAYLYFGVDDNTLSVKGTMFDISKQKAEGNQSLEIYLRRMISPKITFEIEEFLYEEKLRLVVFIIPAAVNEPTCYMSKPYIRVDSHVTELTPYTEWMREIYMTHVDWSAQVVDEATMDSLDGEAINKARFEYKKKNPDISGEINQWDDITFLNKSKLTINGKITNAALILLGKAESVSYLYPSVAQMTWILKDADGIEIDYRHFHPPFILSVDKLLSQIRNITFRYMPNNSLFPEEVLKYDNFVIREALHNCIAHQDYSLRERINVVEKPDELVFTNGGSFLPQSVENVIEQDAPQRYYRNTFLCTAMVNVNMIDTIGSGIKRMFVNQRKRFFPMPDYRITDKEVSVTIYGKVINEKYVNLLKNEENLSLLHIIALDKVQKKLPISEEMTKQLKSRKLIEGRKGKYFISEKVAFKTDEMATFVQNKAFDRRYYMDLTYELIKKQNTRGTTKSEIDTLLLPKLSSVLDYPQKQNYIRNLLHQMVVDQRIFSDRRKYYITEDDYRQL